MKSLAQKLSNTKLPSVLVVGDVMLDRHVTCDVLGMSPEDDLAPKLKETSTSVAPGGAANVAANLKAMGASVHLVGVVGPDAEYGVLSCALVDQGILSDLVVDADRCTTLKTRFLTKHGRHVARIDRETVTPISGAVLENIRQIIQESCLVYDVIIVSDYAKGVVSGALMNLLNAYRKPIIVDPKNDFFTYGPVFAITPNEAEYQAAIDACDGEQQVFGDIASAVSCIVKKRSHHGCELLESDRGYGFEKAKIFKTNERTLGDPTGCGDSFLAAFASAIGMKWKVEEACMLGNAAGAIAYSFTGAHAVSKDELLTELCRFNYGENNDRQN